MKLVYSIIFLVISMNLSFGLNYDYKEDILEIKKASGRMFNELNKMSQDKHRPQKLRIRTARRTSYNLQKTVNNLYTIAVVKDEILNDEGELVAAYYEGLVPQMLKLENLVITLEGQLDFPISSKRFHKNRNKLAYHVEHLLSELIDIGMLTEIRDPIKKASQKHQDQFVENRVHPNYYPIYQNLLLIQKKSEELSNNVKVKAWYSKRVNNKQRRLRDKNYYPLYSKLSYLTEQVEKLSDDLIDTKSTSVDIKLFINRYIDIRDNLNELIELANFSEIETKEKEEIHQINLIHLAIENILINLSGDFQTNRVNQINLTRKAYKYRRGSEVCALVSSPGDIILTKSKRDNPSLFSDFQTPIVARTIQAIELLKFSDMNISYSHAELLTRIKGTSDFQAWSFYPWMFNIFKEESEKKPSFLFIDKKFRHCAKDEDGNEKDCTYYRDYRDSSAILRVKALSYKKERELKEAAIKKLEDKENFKYRSPIGVCSDFVNWTFGNAITSNWNRIPGLRQLIRLAWIPEGYQTPDNLYNSYMTERVCELENKKLTYPQSLDLKELTARLQESLNSSNTDIVSNSERNIKLLKKRGFLDEDGKPLFDIIEFQKR